MSFGRRNIIEGRRLEIIELLIKHWESNFKKKLQVLK